MSCIKGLLEGIGGCPQAVFQEVMETGRTGSIEEPLYSFHEDREAQRKEKNAIDEGTQDFGSLPTIGVLGRSRLVRSELIIQALDSA